MITPCQIHLNSKTGGLSKCLLALRKANLKPVKFTQSLSGQNGMTINVELDSPAELQITDLDFLKSSIPEITGIDILTTAKVERQPSESQVSGSSQTTEKQKLYRGQQITAEPADSSKTNQTISKSNSYRGQQVAVEESSEPIHEEKKPKKKQQFYRGRPVD